MVELKAKSLQESSKSFTIGSILDGNMAFKGFFRCLMYQCWNSNPHMAIFWYEVHILLVQVVIYYIKSIVSYLVENCTQIFYRIEVVKEKSLPISEWKCLEMNFAERMSQILPEGLTFDVRPNFKVLSYANCSCSK